MTAPQEEWGPWIEHDGKGCPCVGNVAHIRYEDGDEWIGLCGAGGAATSLYGDTLETGDGSWNWHPDFYKLVEYRIRKPRALLDLIQLIADLPAPIKTDGVIA